jgi:hypothetical protein
MTPAWCAGGAAKRAWGRALSALNPWTSDLQTLASITVDPDRETRTEPETACQMGVRAEPIGVYPQDTEIRWQA